MYLPVVVNQRNITRVAVAVVLLSGCRRDGEAPRAATGSSEPRASVALRVLVVNEPELAEAMERLRGEWEERTGGELSAASFSRAEIAAAKTLDADVVVFPSRYMGELCSRAWLRPVRANVLESESLDAEDFFPLVRRGLIRWGGQTMALPLGVDLPRGRLPLEDEPGVSLIAAAAPAAVSDDRVGVLFEPESMAPRISELPFVQALGQLAASRTSPGDAKASPTPVVPVLGWNEQLLAVTTSTRNAASAFKLLEWLAQGETSTQLARAVGGMQPVRRSLASSQSWYDSNLTASERTDLGRKLQDALSQQRCLLIPRIPGVDDYMAALDQAVRAAVNDGNDPEAALRQAAQQWDEITDAHGREAQKAAYLKHLGIEEP